MTLIKNSSILRLALFQPDIPQNAGTLLRLAACVGVAVDLIEPCGFVLDDRRLRRSGMDYLEGVALSRHESWEVFLQNRREGPSGGRLILLTTASSLAYSAFAFRPNDTLLVGREGAGVPEAVHTAADSRLSIPMVAGRRSLNVAVAASMVLGEALRQTGTFPAS
ncbi:MAG: tRNA (cytidine(34)-2'-O)-methyltransferase [Alphaproteobacteria bacterium]